MTGLRWTNVVAIAGRAVGLLMAWGTAFRVTVTGLDTDDGKLLGVMLVPSKTPLEERQHYLKFAESELGGRAL